MSSLLGLGVAPLDAVELLLWLPLILLSMAWMIWVVGTLIGRLIRTLYRGAWRLLMASPFRPRA